MRRTAFLILITVAVFLNCLSPASSWAGSGFNLDGRLEDWEGQATLTDREGDGFRGEDLQSVCWGTNENEQRLYFMVERYNPSSTGVELTCRLYMDINGDGNYEDQVDKYAELVYLPARGEKGEVTVKLYTSTGVRLLEYGGYWGEGAIEGGRRFEFYIPMEELNIFPGQPIRFYLAGAGHGPGVDRLPDRGDNQWRPFPVVVKDTYKVGFFLLIWLAGAVVLRRHRIWLFYYIWGAAGFTFIAILLLRGSFVEYRMEQQVGLLLQKLLGVMDIKTYAFDRAPGTLLVLVGMENSWTTIDIDIESSGLLEICIFLGLLLFYPPFSTARKMLYSLAGVVFVYAINIVRLLVIVSMIHWGGRDMIFIAHTLIGRLVFFFLIIALYWHVFTRASMIKARENKENA